MVESKALASVQELLFCPNFGWRICSRFHRLEWFKGENLWKGEDVNLEHFGALKDPMRSKRSGARFR